MARPNTRSSLGPAFSPAKRRPKRIASVSDEIRLKDEKKEQFSETLQNSFDMSREKEMKEDKLRYPGASTWAPAEERLYEILYQRQDLPMLPHTWDYDLSGVPISDAIFQTSEQFPPIIYAHGKDFLATTALLRVIDLTPEVRSSIQCGRGEKVPGLIKRELDRYLAWAARDGKHHHLRTVPNIIAEVVDTTIPKEQITKYIQSRMQALGRLQREFLQEESEEDRGSRFWNETKPSLLTSPRIKLEDTSPDAKKWPEAAAPRVFNPNLNLDELSVETPTVKRTSQKRRLMPSPTATDVDELAQDELDEDWVGSPSRKKVKLEDGSVEKHGMSSLQPRIKQEPPATIKSGTLQAETPKPTAAPRRKLLKALSPKPVGSLKRGVKPTPLKLTVTAKRIVKTETPKVVKALTQLKPETPKPPSTAKRVGPSTETPKHTETSPRDETPKPENTKTPTYRRHPPVVYGLFILNSSVLLLTTDSSRGDDAYVSFHIQVNFSDRHQSVWNALTVAIAVCRARDELMTRLSDFDEIPVICDSDPDA